jgi:Zn finger protein HypA/HybF involved in hydrogenase expression
MTDIKCKDCGHVRETTEEYPTLAYCHECDSDNLKYA